MFSNRRDAILQGAASLLGLAHCQGAKAGSINHCTIVVPFGSGGTSERFASAIAPFIAKRLDANVTMRFVPGRAGLESIKTVVNQEPGRMTIGLATMSTLVTSPIFHGLPTYWPTRKLSLISTIASCPGIIAVTNKFPAKNFRDFQRVLSSASINYTYASPGFGSLGYAQMELLKRLANLRLEHVGYLGSGPALVDASAGQVSVVFDNSPSMYDYIRNGRLTPIAVASNERLKNLPHLPTLSECGFGTLSRRAFYGLVGPTTLSSANVLALQEAVELACDDEAFAERFRAYGATPWMSKTDDFRKLIHSEIDYYGSVLQANRIS